MVLVEDVTDNASNSSSSQGTSSSSSSSGSRPNTSQPSGTSELSVIYSGSLNLNIDYLF